MSHRRDVAAGLQHRQVTGQVGVLIGKGMVDGVAHTRLGGQVHHAGDLRIAHQGRHGRRIGHVRLHHAEAGLPVQPGDPGALQGRVVIGVERVHPDDPLAPGQQPVTDRRTNEAGRAGHDHRHG